MISLLEKLTPALTEDVATQYEKDGFLHLKNVLTPEQVEGLRQVVTAQIKMLPTSQTAYDFEKLAEQMWAGEDDIGAGHADRFDLELYKAMIDHDDAARPMLERPNRKCDKEGQFFYDAAGWRLYESVRNVAFDSALPELCAQLLGTQYLNFWEDTTFVKAPNTMQKTVFHQDYAYFQIRGSKCCIVWIPLDPVTKENGTMQYIRGSHLWNETYAPNLFITQTTMLDAENPKLPDIENNLEQYDIVTVEANPGDVIIHNVMTVHGSGGNMSKDQNRRAMSFRYCGDDITYYDRPGAIPQPYISQNLDNGAPLYSKDYPLVWPKPFPEAKIAPLFAQQNI